MTSTRPLVTALNVAARDFGSLLNASKAGQVSLGTRSEKKRDYVGKILKGEPPPPSLGNPCYQKKLRFIFHFRTSGTFLVFTKKSQF